MATTTEKTKTLYAGNLTEVTLQRGSVIQGALCLNDLEKQEVKDLIYTIHGRSYLNIKVIKRKQVSPKGRTHFIEVDQFKPANKK